MKLQDFSVLKRRLLNPQTNIFRVIVCWSRLFVALRENKRSGEYIMILLHGET